MSISNILTTQNQFIAGLGSAPVFTDLFTGAQQSIKAEVSIGQSIALIQGDLVTGKSLNLIQGHRYVLQGLISSFNSSDALSAFIYVTTIDQTGLTALNIGTTPGCYSVAINTLTNNTVSTTVALSFVATQTTTVGLAIVLQATETGNPQQSFVCAGSFGNAVYQLTLVDYGPA